MSKYRTPPDPAELREAEDGFRRWLLPKGCSDLIDVETQAASESPAGPPPCEYCGATSVLHNEVKTLPAGFLMFSAICKSCASLWRRAWDELEGERQKVDHDASKSTSEIFMAYKEFAGRVRRRVLELIAERKKMKN